MKKDSTQLTISPMAMQLPAATGTRLAPHGPRKRTVEFLKQFARCYSAEPSLPVPALRGAVMN